MERLFRPWRMAYVSGPKTNPVTGGCFLCEAAQASDDAAHLVVTRVPHAFAMLNRYPYNSGHVLIVPLRHVADLAELTREERGAVMDLLVEVLGALKAEMAPDGANVGINLGTAAGAGVPGHLHVHAVPRWSGDTNFMPVLGEAMVLPESLEATHQHLSRRLARVSG